MDAALEVAERRLDNAFCAVRPPGHHAEFDTAMGFCFFNNIALAAEFLSREMGFQRILIIDFDVHHGNGTQHFFEERSDIFFVSMHQDQLGKNYWNLQNTDCAKSINFYFLILTISFLCQVLLLIF